ncbi:MAG: hypothetical protein NUV72_07525 [Bauldia sp.]|nr:hypothetical protein [Bauldia sp.]
MAKVAEFAGAAWSLAAVDKLKELWSAGVPTEVICQTLGRPEQAVRAKAAELGLPLHVEGGRQAG